MNPLALVGVVGLFLAPFTHVFASAPANITPSTIPVPDAAYQVVADIMQSIQTAIYDMIPFVLKYALPIMLLFLVIGLALALFNRFRH